MGRISTHPPQQAGIDENPCRAELTPAQHAYANKRRKEIWHERLDECGFSVATGLDMAAPASSHKRETPEPAGAVADS